MSIEPPSAPLHPILCAHLLRQVDAALIDLLRSLPPSDWDLPSVAPEWKVRDVAAHLLDTALRKLSIVRDGGIVDAPEIHSPQDLIAHINRLNREGVTIYRRLSPSVLIDLMSIACRQSADFHESLDPFAPATFGVSWAGEQTSANWFDTARELTERWHHQQQIRLATNRPGIMTPVLYHPVLDCFLRGLPHLFRNTAASVGTTLVVEISGDCGGQWCLVREPAHWSLVKTPDPHPTARVIIPQTIAWRLFTKGIDHVSATSLIHFGGDRHLGEMVLHLTAIVG